MGRWGNVIITGVVLSECAMLVIFTDCMLPCHILWKKNFVGAWEAFSFIMHGTDTLGHSSYNTQVQNVTQRHPQRCHTSDSFR